MFLDRLDKAILNELQTDASTSNVRLAQSVGLSAPACLKRVKRLEKEGIINRRVAILDQSKIGPNIHMITEIFMHSDRLDLNEAFVKKMREAPQVHECYKVTGEVDFVLIISVPDMPSYEAFCQQSIYSDKNLKKFRTLISIDRVKYDTKIEIT